MTAKETLHEAIKAALTGILKTGNSAPKLYLRVRPSGAVEINEETSWCCSPDEYYRRVPHTMSLEVHAGTRNYDELSDEEIGECADNAEDAAESILEMWQHDIDEWIAAGNLIDAAA
jgi:hypothetical protein